MKTLAAFAALLFAASTLSAQNPPAANPAVKTPVTKDDKNQPPPEPVIPGQTITRTNGTFLGLEVVGGNFKLSFYDKKKKIMAPDISRASARWPNLRSIAGDNRTMLNPSGNALVGSKPVIPPFTFIVRLTLLQGEGDEAKAVENYTVQLHG
jgi:hypothetical protein